MNEKEFRKMIDNDQTIRNMIFNINRNSEINSTFCQRIMDIEERLEKLDLSRGKLTYIEKCVENKFKGIKKEYDELPDVPSSMTRSSILTAKLEMLGYVLGLLGKDLPSDSE